MMKKFLTLREASNYLGIKEDELSEFVKTEKIPSYKIGGVYVRFKVEDLDIYRKKGVFSSGKAGPGLLSDKIKDVFYFNDFYILSGISIIVILYFIFK
ncbi:MAG: helix-turn-helix domain-containing protein [Candidatus Omnitrophota bacterium]